MNRRDCLKTLGSLALMPTLLLRPAKRRAIDLSQFCDPIRSRRYDMRAPFLQDEMVYATDARICVRVPPMSEDQTTGKLMLPPASGLNWRHDQLSGWRRWKPEKLIRVEDVCPDCNGSGFIEERAATCRKCAGEGKRLLPSIAAMGGGLFVAKDYFRLVESLPDAEWIPDWVAGGVREGLPVPFRFDGGLGLVMPLDPDFIAQMV